MTDFIEQVLLNRFDMTDWKTGFIDNYSHMCVAVDRRSLKITSLSPRGLLEWREPMTDSLSSISIEPVCDNLRKYPVYINKTDFLPWVVSQNGIVQTNNINFLSIDAVLFSPKFNTLIWNFKIKSENVCKFRISIDGDLRYPEKKHIIKTCDKGIVCSFNSGTKPSKYLLHPQLDGIVPIWSIRSQFIESVRINNSAYSLISSYFSLNENEEVCFSVQIDYDTVPNEDVDRWFPKEFFSTNSIDEQIEKRKNNWIQLMGITNNDNEDVIKNIRSRAGLLRNEFVWNNDNPTKRIVANYCSITSWSSASFFWDSIISSMGLMYFNMPLAQEAVKSVYEKQRDDGCVPTCSYEHNEGSTLYPQAPITAWALVHMLKYGVKDEFIEEMLPKIRKLNDWFMNTQDHDNDGLPEWRFTGCPADNSPLFDNYALPTCRPLNEIWNTYLPPIASVSLSSFLIMEDKCMKYLYNRLGKYDLAEKYNNQALNLEKRLVDICFENGEMFYDFDHHVKKYNRAMTLYSFMPLWAGVSVSKEQKKNLIEKYILNEEFFFGDYPFPYLAYNEEAYKPNGYWRGRVWPHTTLWILELLWSNGYKKEADEAADRILDMMNQREEILENYNSSPSCPGGGEPDYSWSYASYLMIANREYRKPVLNIIAKDF